MVKKQNNISSSPKRRQQGFGAIIVLVTALVLICAASIGWLAWHNQSSDDSTRNTITSPPPDNNRNATPNIPAPSPSIKDDKDILKISELGIQFRLSESLQDVTYVVKKGDSGRVFAELTYRRLTDFITEKAPLCDSFYLARVSVVASGQTLSNQPRESAQYTVDITGANKDLLVEGGTQNTCITNYPSDTVNVFSQMVNESSVALQNALRTTEDL